MGAHQHLKVEAGPAFLLLLSLGLISTFAQETGSSCELSRGTGTCTHIYNCRDPRPTGLPICSFDRNTPIVCCPQQHVPTVRPTSSSAGRPQRPRPPQQGSFVAERPSVTLGNRVDLTDKSISERKCEEYSKLVSRNVSALLLTADPSILTHTVASCSYNNVQLIVGGEEVQLGEFPHMVALGYGRGPNYEFSCGGSLISENYVLTAAHCTRTAEFGDPSIARLGEHNLLRDDDGATPVDVGISQVLLHPEYRPPKKYHDIALLRLARTVALSARVRPACLPKTSPRAGNKAVATGWGRIQFSEEVSPVLLKVVLPLTPEDTCTQLWANTVKISTSWLPRGIDHEIMMCAGALEGGKDTCLGDSGGPLSISNSDNECIHYIVGVTSFGRFCGGKNSPGIYSRVSYYVPWIESVVWPGN